MNPVYEIVTVGVIPSKVTPGKSGVNTGGQDVSSIAAAIATETSRRIAADDDLISRVAALEAEVLLLSNPIGNPQLAANLAAEIAARLAAEAVINGRLTVLESHQVVQIYYAASPPTPTDTSLVSLFIPTGAGAIQRWNVGTQTWITVSAVRQVFQGQFPGDNPPTPTNTAIPNVFYPFETGPEQQWNTFTQGWL